MCQFLIAMRWAGRALLPVLFFYLGRVAVLNNKSQFTSSVSPCSLRMVSNFSLAVVISTSISELELVSIECGAS